MMFGRMFGRGKDEPDPAVCAECGRTLLAGEWTQKVVDADGEELLICSLCGQTHALSGAEPVAASPTPANNGRVRESREEVREPPAEARASHTESDAFWKALKDQDAGEPLIPSAADPEIAAAAVVSPPTGDSSEPGERTWGETPAEFAAELAELRDEPAAASPATTPADIAPVEPPQPEVAAGVCAAAGAEPAGGPETTPTPEPQPAMTAAAPAEAVVSSIAAPTAADLEAEVASLTLLQ